MAPTPLDDEHAPLYTVGQVAEMLAVSTRVLSVRIRASASWPRGVMARVLARASLGSANRRT